MPGSIARPSFPLPLEAVRRKNHSDNQPHPAKIRDTVLQALPWRVHEHLVSRYFPFL